MINKIAIIRRLPNGDYRLYSKKKGPDGQRRNLGTSDSLSGIKQREKEVQTFKHMSDDGAADDKETKMLSDLSDIAGYLESAGFTDHADKIYMVMNAMDGQNIVDHNLIPDAQRNTENQGYIGGDGIGGGYSLLNTPMTGQPADDKDETYNPYKDLYEMKVSENERLKDHIINLQHNVHKLHTILNSIQNMNSVQLENLPEFIKEQDNVDAAARSNGLTGVTQISNQGSNMSPALSDSYFYGIGYEQLEPPYR